MIWHNVAQARHPLPEPKPDRNPAEAKVYSRDMQASCALLGGSDPMLKCHMVPRESFADCSLRACL